MLVFALLGLGLQAFEPGATLRLYDLQAHLDELADLVPGQTPNIDRLIPAIDLKEGEFGMKDRFLAEVSAEFNAAKAGPYAFKLSSDDGSVVLIDGKTVADCDGIHPVKAVEGTVTLAPGWHKLLVRFFEAEGGEALKLEVKGPGEGDFRVVGGEAIRVPKGLTRVTSPGQKFVKGLGGVRRPGNGMPLAGLHPGWDIFTCRPEDFKPQVGAMAFLPDGSLLVSNFKPNQSGGFMPDLRDGILYRLEGVQGNDRKKIKVTKVAENLQEPLGLAVMDGEVYVAQRNEISRLIDANKDGTYETTEPVAKAWISDNYHHFTFGLAAKDGFLYASFSTSITGGAPGINGPNPPNRGTVIKVNPKAFNPAMPMANVEFLTGGHRTPNGIEVGPYGLLLVGENQGAWQPANKINVIEPGAFHGHYNNIDFKTPEYPNGGVPGPFDEQPLAQPGLYIPQNECGNSPAQCVTIPEGMFKDQMLISDVKYGGLRRGWLEQVDGVWQGGVVQYSQGFEVGTNRMVWGPDGALYIGGIGATETWAWTDPKTGQWTTYGLQRIREKRATNWVDGISAFEIANISATVDGFRVKFTKPLPAQIDPAKIIVRQWTYKPTPEYGGDKIERESLAVAKVNRLADNTLGLTIPGLKEGRVVYLNFDLKAKSGEALWASECWYTLNKTPKPAFPKTHALVNETPTVLMMTDTKGFVHDCIPTARAELTKYLTARGCKVVDVNGEMLESDNPPGGDVIVFLVTTGDILGPKGQAWLQKFIRGGGGFVGVHSATDTHHKWPWYLQLVGAEFKTHPAIQQAKIVVEDRAHPSSTFLPNNWTRVDEWYDFVVNPRSNVRVLASIDEKSYQGGSMGDHPMVWCQEFEGGRSWYTEFGHTPSTYKEELFLKSFYEGLLWTAQAKTPVGAKPVEWTSETGWTQGKEGLNNGGNAPHLVSKGEFGDAWVHAEFAIPAGSNSGVYLQGRYEIQILDSYGKPWKDLAFSDAGGIYQRWKDETGYEGTPPARNAIRKPGDWNTYDILFRAPRFDSKGKKTENARFVEVRVNGVVVQNNVEVTGPTRASMWEDEKPLGPIMLQGDHGPITYRNVWVLPIRAL
ncbi:MAG: ThuA domain-containing protein [Fimbriimonadaceae bacterium]|nr:ThuA domain-containing protein [Fimbriimonadaceae bacterium]